MDRKEIEDEYFKLLNGKSNSDLNRMLSNVIESINTINQQFDDYPEETQMMICSTYLLYEFLRKYIMIRKYRLCANWFINAFIPLVKKLNRGFEIIKPPLIANLVDKIFSGELSHYQARQIFPHLVDCETFEEALKITNLK